MIDSRSQANGNNVEESSVRSRSRARMMFRSMSPSRASKLQDKTRPGIPPPPMVDVSNSTNQDNDIKTMRGVKTPSSTEISSSFHRSSCSDDLEGSSPDQHRNRPDEGENVGSVNPASSACSNSKSAHLKSDRGRSTSPHARLGLRRSKSPHSRLGLRRSISPHSRLLGRSRSRSKSRTREAPAPILVAVTSCRSDAYHQQKAPGSTAMLPRKAPSALKLFHELAVGVKDAYEAMGATPTKPKLDPNGKLEIGQDDAKEEILGNKILYEFMGNLDFLLALVDEVAVDTATRGALKDDTKFKCIRDVIKKCNKVLEGMLVRREKKYTLFFRLVQPTETKELGKIKSWNAKVEKAIGRVTDQSDSDSDSVSVVDSSIDGSSVSSASSAGSSISSGTPQYRGRAMLPAAGKIRGRRATPTPRLRERNMYQPLNGSVPNKAIAAEDGFSAKIAPGEGNNLLQPVHHTSSNLDMIHQSMENSGSTPQNLAQQMNYQKPVQAKNELVDVIRGLKIEKQILKTKEGGQASPSDLKPNWCPKADIPNAVPKLPVEYIHRHRLMKQVVNCLLNRTGVNQNNDTDKKSTSPSFITSITSRHADKAGNGKTTLAVAAIQTVEVRERFSDGIAWIKLGRKPLTEKDVRGLYEEIHRQLMPSDDVTSEFGRDKNEQGVSSQGIGGVSSVSQNEDNKSSSPKIVTAGQLAISRRRFQGGELEGIREDLSQLLCKRKILLCIDDVWRAEDACWFLFNQNSMNERKDNRQTNRQKENIPNANMKDEMHHPFQVLITTRIPGLLGNGMAQEVFVRIFSEHEAVKLLLSSAGRRPYGGKSSDVFSEARIVVKGCGNSPLAVRLAGGMLRKTRRWTILSPTWISLVAQCKSCLNEATQIRSFSKAFGRIVDLAFTIVDNTEERSALRRCFVTFAMAFRNNDMIRVGKGIPREVVLGLFSMVQGGHDNERILGNHCNSSISPDSLLASLETMNLLEKARPAAWQTVVQKDTSRNESAASSDGDGTQPVVDSIEKRDLKEDVEPSPVDDDLHPRYLMHDSVRAIAEDMAIRSTPSFSPPDSSLDDSSDATWSSPFRNAAKYFVQLAQRIDSKDSGMAEFQFHELMVASLTGGWSTLMRTSISSAVNNQSDLVSEIDEYVVACLPSHLIRARAVASAGEILADSKFITRRVATMGPVEATRQQVADLVELRRAVSKLSGSKKDSESRDAIHDSPMPIRGRGNHDSPLHVKGKSKLNSSEVLSTTLECSLVEENVQVDIGTILRDGSRKIIDEVYRVDSEKESLTSCLSLNMAICLSTVGEGLLKCRQVRDAMLRLEEAVGMYRGILGPYHIDVARSLGVVAKAFVKLNESRVALLKFGEAASIFEASNATHHFDALSNSQSMAALLADIGDFNKAEARYEDVIKIRRSVHGNTNPSVARTLNDYAVVLAKHGKTEEAIRQYQEARAAFESAAASKSTFSFVEAGGDFGFIYDAALIDMNIAAIKAKSGDVEGAIVSYEDGIAKMRQLDKCTGNEGVADSRSRHIITSIGKIGSLKLKQGDRLAALHAFEKVLKEYDADESSSTSVMLEAAKARIKCATIRRMLPDDREQNHLESVNHLKEALKMYSQLYGEKHRDTKAVSSSLRQWQQEGVISTDTIFAD